MLEHALLALGGLWLGKSCGENAWWLAGRFRFCFRADLARPYYG